MADQYDVTEGQCPEDCPDVEVATYCINELHQVQNISRVNVKKCCPEDCPCDGEYNSEGCTLCGKCDGHPGFDLPKTFCVADTQPAQNVARVNVNKTGFEAGQVKYTPSTFVESENVQDAITELGDKTNEEINKLLPLIYAGL